MNQAADRHEQANRAGKVTNANANTFSADSLSSGSELDPDNKGSKVSDNLVIQNENKEDRRYREYQQEDYLYRVKVLIKEPFRAGHRIRFNSAIKSALSGAIEFLQGKFDTNKIDKPIKDAMDSQGLPDINYIIFHVKSNALGARRSTTTLLADYNNLTQDVWDVQIEPTILDKYQQYPGWKLDVTIEFVTQKAPPKENSKRSLATAELDPTASPRRRRTRTVQQEEAVEA